MIEHDPKVSKYMWGINSDIPFIDELNEIFSKDEKINIPCPHRFSIGAILFERSLWKYMDYFTLGKRTGLGIDEIKICKTSFLSSKPIMVSKNIVVGHLSFRYQNQEMKEYFLSNKEYFDCK